MVPAESFPTRYRSTVHGIAAASGKLGAIITQVVYAELTKGGVNNGTQDVNKHTRILLYVDLHSIPLAS